MILSYRHMLSPRDHDHIKEFAMSNYDAEMDDRQYKYRFVYCGKDIVELLFNTIIVDDNVEVINRIILDAYNEYHVELGIPNTKSCNVDDITQFDFMEINASYPRCMVYAMIELKDQPEFRVHEKRIKLLCERLKSHSMSDKRYVEYRLSDKIHVYLTV